MAVKRRVTGFLEAYLSLLTNAFFQILIIATWIAFLVISIYVSFGTEKMIEDQIIFQGITIMNINLSPRKLFMEDSSLREMDDLRVQYVIPNFYLANVFVRKPGDLTDGKRVER